MKVSYLSQPVTLPYLVPSKTNLELELKVLQHRQGAYDTGYRAIQNARQKSLNIHFTNQAANGKIKTLNSTIDKQLEEIDGNFGDLSNNNLTNHYLGLFNEYSKNGLPDLYRKEASIRQTRDNLRVMKKSKDPKKAGYSDKHEYVYRKQLEDYAGIDNINDAMGHELPNYVPYKDIVGEMIEMGKKLPWQETTRVSVDASGRRTTITEKSKPGLNRILKQMADENPEQYMIDAQHKWMTEIDGDSQMKQQYINSYNGRVLERKNALQRQKDALKKEDFETEELYTEALMNAQEQINNSTPVDYNISDNDFVDKVLLAELRDNHIADMSRSIGPVSSKEEEDLDPVFKFYQEMAFDMSKQESLDNYREATLELSRQDNQLERDKFKYTKTKDLIEAQKEANKGTINSSGFTPTGSQSSASKFSFPTTESFVAAANQKANSIMNIFDKPWNLKGSVAEQKLKDELRDINSRGMVETSPSVGPIQMREFNPPIIEFQENQLTQKDRNRRKALMDELENPIVTPEILFKNLSDNINYYDSYEFGNSTTVNAAKHEYKLALARKEDVTPETLLAKTKAHLESSTTTYGKKDAKHKRNNEFYNKKTPNLLSTNNPETLAYSNAREFEKVYGVPKFKFLEGSQTKDNKPFVESLWRGLNNNLIIKRDNGETLKVTNIPLDFFTNWGYDDVYKIVYADIDAQKFQDKFGEDFKDLTVETRNSFNNPYLIENKKYPLFKKGELANGTLMAGIGQPEQDVFDMVADFNFQDEPGFENVITLNNGKKYSYIEADLGSDSKVILYDENGQPLQIDGKPLELPYNSGELYGNKKLLYDRVKEKLELYSTNKLL